MIFFFYCYGDHRDLHGLTHSFPTRRSSDLQWQMNKAVHYNAWADLEKGDFLPVVTAFRAFTAHFSCTTCEEMLSITPERGSKAALRCTCGNVNLNLNAKLGEPKS